MEITRDEQGHPVTYHLTSSEYEALLEALEDMEDERDYYAAKLSGETPVPFRRTSGETVVNRAGAFRHATGRARWEARKRRMKPAAGTFKSQRKAG